MNTSLKDKTVVITGASSGIGRELAKQLSATGARLALLARSVDPLRALADELEAECLPISCDVTDETSVKQAFDQIEKQFERIDILINNAGTGFATDLATCGLEDYRRIFETNMTGVFLCARAALPGMKKRETGHVLNISSITGKVSNPNAPLYCASKHALNGYTSGLQQQVAKDGIRVTSVSPSAVDTAYWDGREVDRSKFLKPSEVAAIIIFALSQPEGVLIKDIDISAQR